MKVPIRFGVDATIEDKRVNIGDQAIEEICAYTRCLLLVKGVSVEKVAFGRTSQMNLHLLPVDQVTNALFRIFQRG